MKQRYGLLLLIVFCVTLLAGCAEGASFDVFPAPEEAVTEPAGNPIPERLTAEDLYWKMRLAVSTKVMSAHQKEIRIDAETSDMLLFNDALEIECSYDIQSCSLPYGINVRSQVDVDGIGMKESYITYDYFRKEQEKVICYSYYEHLDEAERWYPDALPSEVLAGYSVAICPRYFPEDMVLKEETVFLEGKEVYVMQRVYSGEEYVTPFGDRAINAQLKTLRITETYYVDAVTYYPSQVRFEMEDLGDLSLPVLQYEVGESFAQSLEPFQLQINEYTYTIKNMEFDSGEVPGIPEEIRKKAYMDEGIAGL